MACPTSAGQRLEIKKGRGSEIKWSSLDSAGKSWFNATISLFDFSCEKTSDEEIGARLTKILTESVRLNSDFLSKWAGLKVTTQCEFPLDWGLGSSSTLIYCISQWADVNPYELYSRTFGGSGYDIACADAKGPILFHLEDDQAIVAPADVQNILKEQSVFVHLGAKADSRQGIELYREQVGQADAKLIDEVTSISTILPSVSSMKEIDSLLQDHERMIGELINMPRIQESRFADYWGTVKSLGAWGGDFAMATTSRPINETKDYFINKGYRTVLSWDEMFAQSTADVPA